MLNLKNRNTLNIVIFIFSILISISFIILKILFPKTYQLIILEDSYIEYIQAIIYFFTSLIALLISINIFKINKNKLSIIYFIFFLGFLFISMEEISWGQRIISFKNPNYFNKFNIQKEFSIHNLSFIQPLLHKCYILVGFFGSFAWLFRIRFLNQKNILSTFLIPSWYVSLYFLPILATYTMLDFINEFEIHLQTSYLKNISKFFIQRDQEPAELLLSIGFFIFISTNYFNLYLLSKEPPSNPDSLINQSSRNTNS